MGSSEHHPLHIFFFPFLAPGHMIPTVDMAKSFAEKGVKATIITTPLNAPFIFKAIGKSKTNGNGVHIQTIHFPSAEAGLPDACENLDSIPSPDLIEAFFFATALLQEQLEQLLLKQRPNCIVADFFFPWTADSAAKFGIPRLVFHGSGFFFLCASTCLKLYEPYKDVSSDSELFLVPNLPGEIKISRMELPPFVTSKEKTAFAKLLEEAKESEERSYGVVVNSFYELEKVYADHFRKVFGRKAWHIGPLSLCNKDAEEKAHRGKEACIDEHECLKWLEIKKPNSVVYVCFGSISMFSDSQLREIAIGLEASGQPFMWVVRKSKEDGVEWLPDGFEKRMKGKGLIIRGWAPQVLILEHEAIGAFVTHCGWNSTLEAVSAGVPMVTWPIAAEQFFNEKLVIEVLKIGVPVGAKKWSQLEVDSIRCDAVEEAVKRILTGEEAIDMKNKAQRLSHLAKQAVLEGGSSYSDLNALIGELSSLSL
ncbi:scopoletin glucosyltransferase-like [Vigna unguiculata]|uniref:Glycosyltransferase n=1 Tax=Vigna unguiculata TaxID=3917 RepID=A0A4D6L452_VIGUN|nr:scopoletin glucosyltransferase-like [Vigna unguiculata]QCD83302.1 UDP-glucosyl transferase 73C [Vigna unguiculata]